MEKFSRDVQVRWSDLDPNFHLRHSVYYDWGAFCRIEYLYHAGFTPDVMQRLHIGPILFREECVFRKEIHLQDKVTIDLNVSRARRDFSRWSIRHRILKNGDILSAVLTVDIAWIDTQLRKLRALPPEIHPSFLEMPRTEDFQWLD